MIRLVFVKLANGKAEELDAGDLTLEAGENVIVDTEKGQVLGRILAAPQEKEKRFLLKSPSMEEMVFLCSLMPSLMSSPWIRLTPQRRFWFFMVRMRCLTSAGTGGLPRGLLREGKRQKDLRSE